MSQVILTNWTIWFADDAPAASTGMKQIAWTGGGGPETNTNTVNELYSEIMHYFSLSANNDADDTTPMNAVTPTVYQIGAFDQGDLEPWFIDPDSMEHLTGGSIQSVGWTRVQDANAGIVKVAYTPTTNEFIASDIGRGVTHDDGDTGTLLWFDATAGEAWIRPTDDTAANNWDSGANDFVADSGTGDVTQTAAPATGERLWSNVVTIGTIEDNTRIYVAQNNTVLSNFWGDGDATTNQIDRTFLVNDGFDAGLIDDGFLTVYARQFSKQYDNFITDVSGGGQTSVPLSTQDEGANNPNGYRNVTVTGASVDFEIDETVTGGTTGAVGVVTANTGDPTTSFQYYLIADVSLDFNSSETLTGSIAGANGSTSGGPTNVNASTYTDITFDVGQLDEAFDANQAFGSEIVTLDGTHPWETEDIVNYTKDGGTDAVGLTEGTLYYVRDLGATTVSLHTSAADAGSDTDRVDLTASGGSETHRLVRTYDVDENDVGENFSIIIDCATRSLLELFEFTKYLSRRGETLTINGIEGQQYIGIDFRVDYTSLTGTIVAGNTLTQALASGDTLTTTVMHHNVIDGYLMLRDTINAPFDEGAGAANLQIDGSNFVVMTGSPTTEAITAVKSAPFGTLAGGTFFGARGVFIENMDGLDANNYQLVTDGGVTVFPPVTVTFQLTGLVTDTEVRLCNSSTDVEIAGTESSSATFSHQYQYAGDITAHVIIHHLAYVWQRINGLTLGNSDQSIPVQQQADRNYENP